MLRDKQFNNYADLMTSNAVKKIHKGLYEEAQTLLNNALVISSDHVEAIISFGACKANQMLFSEATKYFIRALEIDPNNKNALNYLVEATISLAKSYEAKDDWFQATQCYNNILDLAPLQKSSALSDKIKETLKRTMVSYHFTLNRMRQLFPKLCWVLMILHLMSQKNHLRSVILPCLLNITSLIIRDNEFMSYAGDFPELEDSGVDSVQARNIVIGCFPFDTNSILYGRL
ncbi:hypothetical protein MXB_3734 [Myxobolus squamalis]|nr:hypothetical protein MXB_3734 [Myxobolus squamalis]